MPEQIISNPDPKEPTFIEFLVSPVVGVIVAWVILYLVGYGDGETLSAVQALWVGSAITCIISAALNYSRWRSRKKLHLWYTLTREERDVVELMRSKSR